MYGYDFNMPMKKMLPTDRSHPAPAQVGHLWWFRRVEIEVVFSRRSFEMNSRIFDTNDDGSPHVCNITGSIRFFAS